MNSIPLPKELDLFELVTPVNRLEKKLLSLKEFKIGYNWGKPRFGHPEGRVGLHVVEVLNNISDTKSAVNKEALRLLAITHDTFKYAEFERLKHGEKRIHHGILARQFLEGYIHDKKMLEIIERHDEAYHIWRKEHLKNNPQLAKQLLDKLVLDMGDEMPLYSRFFICDTATGDKLQGPIFWFKSELEKRGIEF